MTCDDGNRDWDTFIFKPGGDDKSATLFVPGLGVGQDEIEVTKQ